jgi:acetyl esterase/lipase
MMTLADNVRPGKVSHRALARHSFASGRLAALLFASLASAAFASPCYADQRDVRHVHVGGALSHRPHTFTMQVWYRDIVYDDSADDDQHTSLDVYTADPMEAGSPVMVFVHGGGFRVGDKASSKDLDPKPEYFTSKLGYVLVSTNYRLLPEGRYPRNVQDVANALAWVSDNIGRFGGDPERIFLMGHSAGASLVAQVATDETFLKNAGKDLGLLKGVIANEGTYGVESDEQEAQRQEALLGTNWRNVVPVARVASGKNIPPFLLFHVTGGETLVANSEEQAIGMGSALRSAGVRADVVSLNHVEHFGANERIGEPGDITTIEVERFLDSITGRQTPAQWTSARPLGAGR